MPRSTRQLDRAHRLRDPRAASGRRAQASALGLPHWDAATERQRRDGMCYKSESELYNGGNAFKLCARDARGVIVTLIADNYFGYCKKEVKTQISYSANLYGFGRGRARRRRARLPELQRRAGVHRSDGRRRRTRWTTC
jgi:hypothetical protein